MALEDFRKERIKKLEHLKKAGMDPYPAKTWRTHEVAQALEQFDVLMDEKRHVVLAGRVLARREHGGSTFADIDDGTGKIQVFFKKDVLGEREYQFLLEMLDIGDFIEISGKFFKTKREERSLEAEKYRFLAKSLRPLPEKWHGLQDADERFRKRYLDLLFNGDVKKKFQTKTRIVRELRNFLDDHGFMEVMTPVLQPLYGGASARPFKTHMHALDIDLYLRIAPELYLKRLLVGGFDKVYEFTTNFRNEGMDRDHNPEFSALEFYAAYRDLEWLMGFTENLFHHVVTTVFDSPEVSFQGKKVSFETPFARAAFNDLLKEHAGLDYDYSDEEDFAAKAEHLGIAVEKGATKAALADETFKKTIRPKLIAPTFVTAWPAELLPLAKRLENPDYVHAFQFFAGGLELIKAFGELNDPIDQRERFAAQESKRAKGDEEAQRLDEDFIEAMEYGMPPAAGWGLGLDRFIMLLTDSPSLRETILFPTMRPKESQE